VGVLVGAFPAEVVLGEVLLEEALLEEAAAGVVDSLAWANSRSFDAFASRFFFSVA